MMLEFYTLTIVSLIIIKHYWKRQKIYNSKEVFSIVNKFKKSSLKSTVSYLIRLFFEYITCENKFR